MYRPEFAERGKEFYVCHNSMYFFMALIYRKIIPINSSRLPFQVIEIDDDGGGHQEEEEIVILFIAHMVIALRL